MQSKLNYNFAIFRSSYNKLVKIGNIAFNLYIVIFNIKVLNIWQKLETAIYKVNLNKYITVYFNNITAI